MLILRGQSRSCMYTICKGNRELKCSDSEKQKVNFFQLDCYNKTPLFSKVSMYRIRWKQRVIELRYIHE